MDGAKQEQRLPVLKGLFWKLNSCATWAQSFDDLGQMHIVNFTRYSCTNIYESQKCASD